MEEENEDMMGGGEEYKGFYFIFPYEVGELCIFSKLLCFFYNMIHTL